jgi:hypothetical protein
MGRPRFRPLRPFSRVLIGLLGAQVVTHLLQIDAIVDRLSLRAQALGEGGVTWADLDAVSARWISAGRWGLLLLIATAIVWCVWQFHAQTNLVKRHVPGLRTTPGWAVGWWFVPVANLWKPYRAMSELARASDDPEGWRAAPRPWALVPWWLTWIASTTITRVVSLQASPSTPEAARLLDLTMVVASVSAIVSAILAMALVTSITADQERMAADAPPLFADTPPRPGG